MNEKSIPVSLTTELFWTKRDKFVKFNPMGTVPFLMAKPDVMIAGSHAICEYLEEIGDETNILINGNPLQRAEIRRICTWFDEKFFREVSEFILYERVFNFFKTKSEPNQDLIKIARNNLQFHLKYIQFLLSKRNWIAGKEFSLGDITAAAHISVLDYLGEIKWNNYSVLKDWYSIVKSRPSFREITLDVISGFKPSATYKELDF